MKSPAHLLTLFVLGTLSVTLDLDVKLCGQVLNLRNSETQHHRANLRQLTSKLPGTPTRAELSVSEGRLNLNPSTTNASVGAIAPTEGSSL